MEDEKLLRQLKKLKSKLEITKLELLKIGFLNQLNDGRLKFKLMNKTTEIETDYLIKGMKYLVKNIDDIE